jgi:ribonuclease D
MKQIDILSTAAAVKGYLENLRLRRVEALALDLEADQGSYRYRYSISIFQCFDGINQVVIDVLALGSSLDTLRELLEAPDIVKIMFSSKNDLFITQNVLDCGIAPIRDIAAAQKILGLKVNLSDRLGIDKTAKDKFQRANWLIRPISRELLQYAAGDVAILLEMEAELRALMTDKYLADRYRDTCAALTRADYRIDQYRQYENKFPGFSRLNSTKKDLARLVWIFRELVGEHFDCPVGYILSTKALPAIVDDLAGPGQAGGKGTGASLETRFPVLVDQLTSELNKGRRPEKRINRNFVVDKLAKAQAAITGGLA